LSFVDKDPPLKPCRASNCLLDVGGDAAHGIDDVAREETERAKHRDRNHGQNDTVLSHGLPLLVNAIGGELLVDLKHLIHLPSVLRPACLAAHRIRALFEESGGVLLTS
jgi:hypothetical protein